jgi:hypothetical protein
MGRCCFRLETGFARDNRFSHGPKLADLMADWRGLQGDGASVGPGADNCAAAFIASDG